MMKNLKALVSIGSGLSLGLAMAGCSDNAPDVELNSPILEAIGQKFVGKDRPEPDLPERAPLVMPPNTADLPAPNTTSSAIASNQQWPTDRQDQKALAAAKAKADQEAYCKEGDWKKKDGTIDDYDKNTGAQTRCRPSWFRDLIASKDENEADGQQKK